MTFLEKYNEDFPRMRREMVDFRLPSTAPTTAPNTGVRARSKISEAVLCLSQKAAEIHKLTALQTSLEGGSYSINIQGCSRDKLTYYLS